MFESSSWRDVLDITLYNNICQWLATVGRCSPGTLVSTTNTTHCHDITKILVKVVLNTINHISRVAEYRFLSICLNRWHTAKLYIFGKSRTWLIEISMSSLSSVVMLWDNLGQRSYPYFSKKCYQTWTIYFVRTFFLIFIQKTVEVVEKWSRYITPYNFTL